MLSTKHFHTIRSSTPEADGHNHFIHVRTLSEYRLDSHRHVIHGEVEGEDGHLHSFETKTGLAVVLPDGSHFHDFSVVLNGDSHEHVLKSSTSASRT